MTIRPLLTLSGTLLAGTLLALGLQGCIGPDDPAWSYGPNAAAMKCGTNAYYSPPMADVYQTPNGQIYCQPRNMQGQ